MLPVVVVGYGVVVSVVVDLNLFAVVDRVGLNVVVLFGRVVVDLVALVGRVVVDLVALFVVDVLGLSVVLTRLSV